jgi:hypothetical protein
MYKIRRGETTEVAILQSLQNDHQKNSSGKKAKPHALVIVTELLQTTQTARTKPET